MTTDDIPISTTGSVNGFVIADPNPDRIWSISDVSSAVSFESEQEITVEQERLQTSHPLSDA